LNAEGGIYTDSDFVFKNSIEDKIHKFDFFGITDTHGSEVDPCFFASKAGHPVLAEALGILKRHFQDSYELFSKISEKGINRTTIYGDVKTLVIPHNSYLTVMALKWGYFKGANKDGNIDVLFSGIYVSDDGRHVVDGVANFVRCVLAVNIWRNTRKKKPNFLWIIWVMIIFWIL
jgi:hypothetical protein